MRKILLLSILALIIVLVGRLLFMMVPASGVLNTIETVGVDRCTVVEVAPGPEDIQIDHGTGLAYIAAADRRDRNDDRQVGLYVLDLTQPDLPPRRLEGALPDGFTPHGISFWRGETGERRLFVVNHPRGKHSIEIFALGGADQLTHLETVTSEKFTFPNDVVGVGPRQFYTTNMQRAAGGFALTLELYLGLPVANVVHFDGSETRQVAGGLITANGVNMSADGTEFYVAEAVARRVNVYKRDPATGELSGRKRFSLGTGPDNIDVAPDGALYMGSHPDMLAYTKFAVDPDAISPSHVVRFDPATGTHETVFMSVNGEIDGSSTGPYWNGNLLVGGVFESHVMWCRDP